MKHKIRCLILEDEYLGREIIENFVKKTPFLTLVGSFENPLEALEFLQNNAVDLLFSDIEMPEITGLQFINSLDQKPLIILITAFEKYAIEGFEEGVVDYLVKPVAYDRFLKAAVRANELLDSKKENQEQHKDERDRIFIKADHKLVKIVLKDIVYIEALKDYLRIHLSASERYVTYSTMKAMEAELPDYFYRIQRSYIINTKHLKSIDGNTVQLTLGDKLPVSKSKKVALYKKLNIADK